MEYEALLREALDTPFEGWDFGVFGDRFTEEPTSWDYRELVTERLANAESLLDMGTGGGEFLASLAPLPPRAAATEGYPPNLPVARGRLAPYGVEVVAVSQDGDPPLPFDDNSFDLVINRHESLSVPELPRVLKPSGVFVTQQVGGRNLAELHAALGAPPSPYADWNLATAVSQLEAVGFEIVDRREELVDGVFRDIGAVALYLRIAPWELPDFSFDAYDERLRGLHRRMITDGPLPVRHHRFTVTARLP